MNIAKPSTELFNETFNRWKVDKEYSDPMFEYLVYGLNPGSFFQAVLANEFFDAIESSHPLNTIEALKRLVGWIRDFCPGKAYGSYYYVKEWIALSDSERRKILEDAGLIYTEEEEVFRLLGEKSNE